jgi:hypothetical protein
MISVSVHNDNSAKLCPTKCVSPIDARGLLPIAHTTNKPMRIIVQKARDSRSMSCSTLILVTCATVHTKIKGLPSDVPFYSTFYMHSVTYKKQGALDQCPILLLYFLQAQSLSQDRQHKSGTYQSHLSTIL